MEDKVEDEADRDNPRQGRLYVSCAKDGKRIAGWIHYEHVLVDPYHIDREPLSAKVRLNETTEETHKLRASYYIGGKKMVNGGEWYQVKYGWSDFWIKKGEFEAYIKK